LTHSPEVEKFNVRRKVVKLRGKRTREEKGRYRNIKRQRMRDMQFGNIKKCTDEGK
jgi:hypothetical protein